MAFCGLDTSMLIRGRVYHIQMRRDNLGDYWKYDVVVDSEDVCLDLNTRSSDFEKAAAIIRDHVRIVSRRFNP